MTHWHRTTAAIGGTLATITLDRLNVVLGFLCGLLTFLLLVRSCFRTFRRDWREWRREPPQMPALVEKAAQDEKKPGNPGA